MRDLAFNADSIAVSNGSAFLKGGCRKFYNPELLSTEKTQTQKGARLSLSGRKTRSREERESFMSLRHTPTIGRLYPVVGVVQLDKHAVCVVSGKLGAMVAERLFGRSANPGKLSNNPQHGQPAGGLSQNLSRGHLGANWARSCWFQWNNDRCGEHWSGVQNPAMVIARGIVMLVLNVCSRVTWLELDDKALLDKSSEEECVRDERAIPAASSRGETAPQ